MSDPEHRGTPGVIPKPLKEIAPVKVPMRFLQYAWSGADRLPVPMALGQAFDRLVPTRACGNLACTAVCEAALVEYDQHDPRQHKKGNDVVHAGAELEVACNTVGCTATAEMLTGYMERVKLPQVPLHPDPDGTAAA